jgi:hypothetical protein
MSVLDSLAEQKIQEAVSRGELDDLPGAGRPLALEDDALVPEDLRVAYRLLKNAGFVPPEVETFSQIAQLERLVADEAARPDVLRKIALLRAAASARRPISGSRTRRRPA